MLDAAFLADIAEHPTDDAPRWIYADWLEDQGNSERAEFIRVQIRRLQIPEEAWEQRQLAGIEAALLEQHGADWRALLPTLEGIEWGQFCRGFVWEARARTAAHFLQHAQVLFSVAPVQVVRIRQEIDESSAGDLAGSPYLERLTELNVSEGALANIHVARRLLASPHLGSLLSLLMHYNPLGDDLLAVLLGAGLPRLREMYVSGCGITQEGLARLSDEPALATLRLLDLRDNALQGVAVRALARWACAPHLQSLYLVNNHLGPSTAADLAHLLPALQRLYLNHNTIGDSGAEALAGSDMAHLRELDVRYGDLRDPGLLALAASPLASRLRQLWLMAGHPMNLRTTPAELRRLLGPRLAG